MRSPPAPAELARRKDTRHRAGLAWIRLFLLGVLACGGLAACAVGPDYRPPDTPMPASFVALSAPNLKSANGRRPVDPSHWWHALHDRELESLIERTVTASPTVEIALNRVQEARAQEAVVIGTALPAFEGSEGGALGTGGDLARGRAAPALVSAENGTGFTQVTNLVGFDAGWELDFFGKLRRAIEAAHYDVQAAIAARNIVLVSLIADVTRAYLEMRALQMQLVVLRKSIEVAQRYLDFVQERFNRGITNELDVTPGATRARAIAVAGRAADRADRCGAIRDRRSGRRLSRALAKELRRPGTCRPCRRASSRDCRSSCCAAGPTLPRRNANWPAPPR